jgi:DNA repair photolyase
MKEMKDVSMKNYNYFLAEGIRRSPKFEEKGLAQYAINVGLRCGHDCTYCSSRAMLRHHPALKKLGKGMTTTGFSIVDPDIAKRVAKDAQRIKRPGLVQICTTVDAWSPESQKLGLGRQCLEAVLAQPGWTVRILTKNAAVVEDFDLIKKYRDRVLVGLSLTATPDRESVISVIEPHASPISERMKALKEAAKLGLRTYGMLCPLLPGIADAPDQIDELVQFVADCGAEEVFSESVNARGNSLTLTEQVLRDKGFTVEAEAIAAIRKEKVWSSYVVGLLKNLQQAMQKHMATDKLRYLLYPKGLTPHDRQAIQKDDAGVVWL